MDRQDRTRGKLGFLGLKSKTRKDGFWQPFTDPLDDCRPFAAASVFEHHSAARLIREHRARRREGRVREELERLGWSTGFANEEAELVFTGTEPVADPDGLIESAWADPPAPLEVPFTAFEGWTRQTAVEDLIPFAQEAVESAFPLFYDLVVPPLKMLERIPVDARSERSRRFPGQRL